MRATWAPSRAGRRLGLAGGLLSAALALAGCGGNSALRLVTAPSEPAAPSTAPSIMARPSKAASAAETASAPSVAGTNREVAEASDSGSSAAASGAARSNPTASSGSRAPTGATGASPDKPDSTASQSLPSGSRLEIPSIGVDASIVTLGVDPDGVMQVPDNGNDVGWYAFSAPPGMPGNAVLSGHLDTTTSPVAVFSRLKELKHGDALDIVEDGKKIDYSVFWSKSWGDDVAPLALILGNAPSPTLTMITCSGSFNRATKNYSERLVVRAKLPGSV